jgi:Bacterial Ig-like domain (group 3)
VKSRLVVIASLLAVAGLVATGGPSVLTASASPASNATAGPVGSWGSVQAVPGLTAHEESIANDVSCAPHGTCVAVGAEASTTGPAYTPFYVTDENGTWGKPQSIPGLATAFGANAYPTPELVACPAAGDCLITGDYNVGTGPVEGFVVEEAHGKWTKPAEIRGLSHLNTGGAGYVDALSCAAPGYCTVASEYSTAGSYWSEYVVDEVNHKWTSAAQVPGLAKLNVGGQAQGALLECPSPRNCTLVGSYTAKARSSLAKTGHRANQVQRDLRGALRSARPSLASQPHDRSMTAFLSGPLYVDKEVGGSWKQASAAALPGMTATGFATVRSNLACASAGNCLVAGVYLKSLSAKAEDSFLLTEKGGTWSEAAAPGGSDITALACPSLGNCEAGTSNAKSVASIIRQVNGVWKAATALPGAATLSDKGKKAEESSIIALTCSSVGNCTVEGAAVWSINKTTQRWYSTDFVDGEAGGTWSAARLPGGLTALDTKTESGFLGLLGQAGVSCASAATCAVVGSYVNSGNNLGGFALAEVPLKRTATTIGLSLHKITDGKEQSERISVRVTAAGGTPRGKVAVMSGTHTICAITLTAGKGSCVLPTRRLSAGRYPLVARYPGTFGFGESASPATILTVIS